MKKFAASVCFLVCLFFGGWSEAPAQFENVPFVYQGSLKDGGAPANGNYQMIFEFFTAPTGGTPFLSVSNASIPVTNGIFSVTFTGGTTQFVPGGTVWIETSVRRAGSTDPFTPLAPRQRVAYAPLAISSLLAGDAQRLGGVEANQYLTTSSGATAFIQNGTTPQNGGFNLSGTGTANVLNAATQFNLNGSRILSAGGTDNLFAGFQAGQANTSGGNNSFFGVLSGGANTTGNFNSFFGRSAGGANTGGAANSFFGAGAGGNNGMGERNTFFGFNAGLTNSTGSFNTVLGSEANFAAGNLTNATALGYRAFAGQSNSLVLGSIEGVNGASANTNVGIGTTTPAERLDVNGSALVSGTLKVAVTANLNGDVLPLDVQGRIRSRQPLPNNPSITAGMFLAQNNAQNLPEDRAFVGMRDSNTVGFYSAPLGLWVLHTDITSGITTVSTLGSAGVEQVCRNLLLQLSGCSSSIRYKENVSDFRPGLSLIRRLRPVSFDWKASNRTDLGLVAEEVAAVEPLLTTRNDKGEIEGVKYDRVGVVLVNAVGEQQTQIETQQKQLHSQAEIIKRQQEKLERQQSEIEALKELVCAGNTTAEICREKKP